MKLYDFHPGDIFTAAMTVSGWVFTGQRFVVWRVYEDGAWLIQQVNTDTDGEPHYAQLLKVRFDGDTADFPGGRIQHPVEVGTYKPNDEGANGLEIMAAAAERSWAKGWAYSDLVAAKDAADWAQANYRKAVAQAARADGANIRQISLATGLTRQTIYTWRDEHSM